LRAIPRCVPDSASAIKMAETCTGVILDFKEVYDDVCFEKFVLIKDKWINLHPDCDFYNIDDQMISHTIEYDYDLDMNTAFITSISF